MNIKPLSIADCYEIELDVRPDERGFFAKIFLDYEYEKMGFATKFCEEYFTSSKKGVLRGMHFQLPPKALNKVVCCVSGQVLDVFLDLRVGSPTFLQSESVLLDGKQPKVLYLPVGIAHGYQALLEESIMFYMVDQPYVPSLDAGISWDSFGFSWPVSSPILSKRDLSQPKLQDFNNPFVFGEDGK